MKRWGTITLMLFAFVVGFVSTYNCGGGSSSNAQDYAPLVHTHAADDITGGVLDVSLIPDHNHPGSSSTQYISVSFLGGGYNWDMSKVAVDDDEVVLVQLLAGQEGDQSQWDVDVAFQAAEVDFILLSDVQKDDLLVSQTFF